jgi:hypothetical protein
MVGMAGLAPALYLTWPIYSRLSSLLDAHTQMARRSGVDPLEAGFGDLLARRCSPYAYCKLIIAFVFDPTTT